MSDTQGTVTGFWSSAVSTEFTVQPIGKASRVGRFYFEFDGLIDGRIQPFCLICPMDRRQARRVSRRTGKRFRVHQGEVIWHA